MSTRRKMLAADESIANKIVEMAKRRELTVYQTVNDVLEQAVRADEMGLSLIEVVDEREMLEKAKKMGLTFFIEGLLYDMVDLTYSNTHEQLSELCLETGRWYGKYFAGKADDGMSAFNEAMRYIALGRQGKGVMVILSDFMLKDGYEKGLRYLAGGGYDTFCLQILSPEEVDPGRHGLAGDLRLTDIEDDDVAEITVSAALLKQYKDNLDTYCGRLRDFCVRRGVMHVTIDSSTDLTTLLLDYLRKRGLLK